MNERLQVLVKEIFQLNETFNRLLGLHFEQTLNAPATEAEIDALETYLDTKLPPSYRNLLTICNGWVGFATPLNLLSCAQQMQGEYAHYIHQWKGEQWAEGESVPVEGIIFGIALNTNQARLFDTNTVNNVGEMEAIWWEDGELHRYANLTDMLEQYREQLQFLIKRERNRRS